MLPLITGLDSPCCIAISGSDLFVANATTATVGEYTTSGTTVNASLITDPVEPMSIAVSGSDLFVGYTYGGTYGGVAEYTTSGAEGSFPLLPGVAASGIAVSGSDLFVTNSDLPNTVGEYTTSGATLNASLITGLNGPSGIVVIANSPTPTPTPTPTPSPTPTPTPSPTPTPTPPPSPTPTPAPTPAPAPTRSSKSLVTVESLHVETIRVGSGDQSRKQTVLVVQFSGALNASAAADVEAYELATVVKVGVSGSRKPRKPTTKLGPPVPVASAVYTASVGRVKLTLQTKLTALEPEELIVNGELLTDRSGREIDGAHNGQAGSDYIATISGTRVRRGEIPLL